MGRTMTWPFTGRELTALDVMAEHRGFRGSKHKRVRVSRDRALSHSGAWACLRLRADLISTMPVDVFRKVGGIQVEQAKPPVFIEPGGSRIYWPEWCYSTQIDLDSVGNTFGLITAVDGLGKPARIELVNADEVTVRPKRSAKDPVDPSGLVVQVGGDVYAYSALWHEKQYTVSGLPIGLSPIAYAAMTLSGYLSAQQFAFDWFNNSATPAQHLKNTNKTLDPEKSNAIKQRYLTSMADGDVFVSGNDWELNMLSAKASEAQFLETMQFSITDAARFLGVPGDLIDAESRTGSITYANITQRNLQLLIMNLGPAIVRRETAFTHGLVAGGRYVKLNTGALLRMDLKSRYDAHKVAIDSRMYPPSRALAFEDMPPLTPAEEAEFARLFPKNNPTAPALPGGTS